MNIFSILLVSIARRTYLEDGLYTAYLQRQRPFGWPRLVNPMIGKGWLCE
jgi:hypothetical protein